MITYTKQEIKRAKALKKIGYKINWKKNEMQFKNGLIYPIHVEKETGKEILDNAFALIKKNKKFLDDLRKM